MPDALVILDKDLKVDWANAVSQPLLGFAWPATAGRPIMDLIGYPALRDYIEGAISSQSSWISRIQATLQALYESLGESAMPRKPKYIVTLTDDERVRLEDLTRKGKCAARKLKRAQIVLKTAAQWKYDVTSQ